MYADAFIFVRMRFIEKPEIFIYFKQYSSINKRIGDIWNGIWYLNRRLKNKRRKWKETRS